MIVKFFDDDISGLKHDEKGGSIYLAGPTRWNVHLKSWRKEAVNILESLGYEGLVFCPEYENDKFVEDYKEKDEWREAALESANTIVYWVSKNYPIKIFDSAEFAYWISKKPESFFYGREPINSNYEQTFFLNWFYEKKLECKPFNKMEDLLLEAIIHATENKVFGYSEKEMMESIDIYRASLSANSCSCPDYMYSWRKELNGRLVTALKSKVV